PTRRSSDLDKLDLLSIDGEQFVRKLDFNAGKIDRQIVQMLTGVSPFLAKEVIHRANLGSNETYRKVFNEFQEEVASNQFVPMIYRNEREDFHVINLTYQEAGDVFTTANEMVDAFYSNKAERDRVKQQARDLERVVKNEIAKNERKVTIHEKTIKKSEKAPQYQKQGELLTANMHLVHKGDATVTVIDYYDPEQAEITIHLQTDKTPSENAQHFYKQ